MKRFLTLVLILAASIASALFVRDFLTGTDLHGSTLLPLGVASLKLQYTINTGVNFGLAGDTSTTRQLLLSVASLLICTAVIIWGTRTTQRWAAAAVGLFAGGGLANAYERMSFGGVFDYLNFSMSFFKNPYSFNLADIYIFLGLVLFLLAPRETHDPADGPIKPGALNLFLKTIGNFGLTLALFISCIYVAWQVLSQADFLYDQIYDQNNLEVHINEFAPQNRNGKENFALTTKTERVRVFGEIAREINTGGGGLGKITYVPSGAAQATTFLVEAERDHLQDVAELVSSLKIVGAAIASLLIAFYAFCWCYKVIRYRYFWQPSSNLVSLVQIATVSALCVAITFAVGPQQTFYLLHEWAFSGKAQWYFHFQDSLMTTLMPEVVFANIVLLLITSTILIWLVISFLLRRVLA